MGLGQRRFCSGKRDSNPFTAAKIIPHSLQVISPNKRGYGFKGGYAVSCTVPVPNSLDRNPSKATKRNQNHTKPTTSSRCHTSHETVALQSTATPPAEGPPTSSRGARGRERSPPSPRHSAVNRIPSRGSFMREPAKSKTKFSKSCLLYTSPSPRD